jgi:hypothetical protein
MKVVITKDLIAQHNLTDDECKKIVEILGREPMAACCRRE